MKACALRPTPMPCLCLAAETPRLDRLAAWGTLLAQFSVNELVCSQRRRTFLTGQKPAASGIGEFH